MFRALLKAQLLLVLLLKNYSVKLISKHFDTERANKILHKKAEIGQYMFCNIQEHYHFGHGNYTATCPINIKKTKHTLYLLKHPSITCGSQHVKKNAPKVENKTFHTLGPYGP